MGRFGVRGLLAISACMTMSAVGAVVAKAIAQPAKSEELYYLSFGQKIPLKIKENVIAVEGKPSNQLSGGELYSRTLKRYLRGDNTLSGSNDNSNPPGVQIDSIGNRYALIGFSSTAKREQIQKNIKAEPNLNATLPVLNLGDRDSSMLVLPNRIVVGFKTGTSTEVIQKALKRQNVEIIRKETFAEGIYVVRSKGATGIAVLQVANQLSQEIGVEYATPDFIQLPGASSISPESQASESKSPDKLRDTLRSISPDKYSPTSPRYLPLQWNLDSFPLRQCLAATNTWDCLFKDSLPDKSTAVKRIDI